MNIDKEQIIDYQKIDRANDFYNLAPGNNRYRPKQTTPIKDLYLARDYTLQPYFATMEGAVTSRIKAAKLIEDQNKN
ncbi:FAD-dependent oxidoreductase [Pseudalkalibacillus sp. A8]|uniref:FAD-dependent oxidoreductase n=1 Tax=Pseudalkalibacillus sp. A8 TaxID=3382641 RepID=UPI0038B58A52